MSATPLRAAIQRLAATGLVEVAPPRGARVALSGRAAQAAGVLERHLQRTLHAIRRLSA